jgi:hypothetical protein
MNRVDSLNSAVTIFKTEYKYSFLVLSNIIVGVADCGPDQGMLEES